MTIQGHIIDSNTGEGISSASVTIVDRNGTYLGQGVYADGSGNFGLVSPLIDGNFILITDVGYAPVMIDPIVFQQSTIRYDIDLVPSYSEIPEVVVTPNKKNYAWLWLVGIGTVAVVAESSTKKKPRIGDTSGGFDVSKVIIPLGVVGLGYAILSPLLQKLGVTLTPEEQALKAAADKAAKDQIAAGASTTGTQDFVDKDLKSIAFQIINASMGWTYEYDTLATMCAYFAGFRNADAKKFLGFFATTYGRTLYQWFLDRFKNQLVTHAGLFVDYAKTYPNNYAFMGLGNFQVNSGKDAITYIETVVKYVYKVANASVS